MRAVLTFLFTTLVTFAGIFPAHAKESNIDERISLARFHMQEVTPKDARFCHKKLRKLKFDKEGYRANGDESLVAYEIATLVPLIWADLNARAKGVSKKHEVMLIGGEFVRSYASPEYSGLYVSGAELSRVMICMKLGVESVARIGIVDQAHPDLSKPVADPEQEKFRQLGEDRIVAGYRALQPISSSDICDCVAYAQYVLLERQSIVERLNYLIWVNLLQQEVANDNVVPSEMSSQSSVWRDLSNAGKDAVTANSEWANVVKKCSDLSGKAIEAAKEVSI